MPASMTPAVAAFEAGRHTTLSPHPRLLMLLRRRLLRWMAPSLASTSACWPETADHHPSMAGPNRVSSTTVVCSFCSHAARGWPGRAFVDPD